MVSKKSLRIAGIINLCIGIVNFGLFTSYTSKVNDYESRARIAVSYGNQSDARFYQNQANLYRNSKTTFQILAITMTSTGVGLLVASREKYKKEN